MNKYYYNLIIIFMLSISILVIFSSSNSYAFKNDDLKIINARNNLDIAKYSSSGNEESFYTINTNNGKTTNGKFTDLADGDTFKKVIGDENNNSLKKELVKEYLSSSDLYSITDKGSNTIEVTRLYSNLRIRVNTKNKNVNSYGAESGVFFDNYYLFKYSDEASTKKAYDNLVRDYGSLNVILDLPIKLDSLGWGTNYMNFNTSYLTPSVPGNITIAVLDTGINKNHNIFNNTSILKGINLIDPTEDESDDRGHGTAVSGIIAESISDGISILPIKVLNSNGSGSFQDILNGLDYAEKRGADIANLSLAVNLSDVYLSHDKDIIFNNIKASENIISKYKMIIVCANGNENLSTDNVFTYPAVSKYTIAVGSINEDSTRSSFSNYGSTLDFVAPGDKIMVADYNVNTRYRFNSGTSFSTPYISAAIARIKSIHPEYSNSTIKYYLIDIAKDLGDSGKDNYYGYGVPIFNNSDTINLTNRLLENYNLSLDKTYYTYTGNNIKPIVKLTDKSGNVLNSKYYDVSYINNKNAGISTVVVTGKNKYYGSISDVFKIYQANINSKVSTNLKTNYSYTGKKITPKFNIYVNGMFINKNDYDIKYLNNKNIGLSTIKVIGKNNFKGSFNLSFKIVPNKPSITTLSRYKKKARVVWKSSGNSPIYYKIKYKKVGSKKWYTKKTNRNYINIKGLKRKTSYYVKIKAYKKINNKTYKSSYSNIYKFKTR